MRLDQRVSVHRQVVFLNDDKVGRGTMINLSSRGCAVESDDNVKPGTYFALCIRFLDSWKMEADLAVVRWTAKEKFGLEFVSAANENPGRLNHSMKSAAVFSSFLGF